MTLEDATIAQVKHRAMVYINRFRRLNISLEKSKLCALEMVKELKRSYDRSFKTDYEQKQISEMEWERTMLIFDELIKAIKAF